MTSKGESRSSPTGSASRSRDEKPARVLYHIIHRDNVYAYRFISQGHKDAFEDLGHEFQFIDASENLPAKLDTFQPDLFLTSVYLLPWVRRRNGLRKISEHRRRGMVVGALVPAWDVPGLKLHSLKWRPDVLRLARQKIFPDFYHSVYSQERMREVTDKTGIPYLTLPAAANSLLHFPDKPVPEFECDAAYVGQYTRQKRSTFREYLDPLFHKYNVQIHGRDWTWTDRRLGMLQTLSQVLGFRVFDHLRKAPLRLEQERQVYSSSKLCLNLHDAEQRRDGDFCNARTFVIAACGGFQLSDDVAAIRNYFSDSEIAIAKDSKEWTDAVAYYLAHQNKRREMAANARKRVLAEHTYHHRVRSLLEMAERIGAPRSNEISEPITRSVCT